MGTRVGLGQHSPRGGQGTPAPVAHPAKQMAHRHTCGSDPRPTHDGGASGPARKTAAQQDAHVFQMYYWV